MTTEISDWNDLDNVRNDLTADYVLVNDLDSETDGYGGIGDDFEPIGFIEDDDNTSEFAGSFDGDGFSISDLVIEYDGVDGDIALFASTDTGALIENLSVAGSVTVTNSDGNNYAGLVGKHDLGTIQNCVSRVDVTSDGDSVGGLVGTNDDTVTDSYATGSVEGDTNVAGLVGTNDDTVTDSYATGSVEGDERVGGLVGNNRDIVTESYATGSVEGDTSVGGLVGEQIGGETSDSYWDTETSGQSTSDGGTGLTTSEMQGSEAETNMDGFDFVDVWDSVLESDDDASADGYPILIASDRENQLDAQGILIPFIISVQTNAATDIGSFAATLNGELVELDEEADDADVFFEFGETVGDSQTEVQTLDTLGTFDDAVEITTSDQTIEFRAVAEAEDADNETFHDEGDTLTFTTDTATIEGVINPDDPIEGAVVKAENKSTGENYGRDETDADGQYAFENISGLELGQMLELLIDAKRPEEDENLSTVLAPTVGE